MHCMGNTLQRSLERQRSSLAPFYTSDSRTSAEHIRVGERRGRRGSHHYLLPRWNLQINDIITIQYKHHSITTI